MERAIAARYPKYVQSVKEGDTPSSEQEFRNGIVRRLIVEARHEALIETDKTLNKRHKALQQLAKDQGLKVNVDGILGIRNYVKQQLDELNKYRKEQGRLAKNEIVLPF
jgi:hypothetical protein